jgi:tRNA(Ile)-lysidine synthase
MTKIFLKFRKSIEKYDLITKNDNILLSFSGGPDSTALALLFLKLKKYLDFDFSLIYFNHKLRDDSDIEEKKVREFANKFSLNLIVRHIDNLKSIKSNIEEKARDERYKLLKDEVSKGEFNKIATAHNLNDQVETFFIRLFRGSGSDGLSSIPIIRENLFIRPLIEIKKKDIISYLDSLNISYVIDKTNKESKYLRNKIRNNLIPLIEKEFNPSILNTVRNIIDILKYNDDFINKICLIKTKELFIDKDKLNIIKLKKEEQAVQRGVIREYIKRIKGNLRKISYKHIETILSLKEGQKTVLPDSLILTVKKGILKRFKENKTEDFLYTVNKIPFSFYIKEIDKYVKIYKSTQKPDYNDFTIVVLNSDKIEFPIIVRNRKQGDKYKPLGLKRNAKKIKEILIDKKIDRDIRNTLPLFINGKGEIMWMQNLPVSENFKIEKGTKEFLIIEIE